MLFQTADLSKALDDELACVVSFRQLLDEERKALTASDLDQVAALAENKLILGQRLQQQVEHRETVRRALIKSHDAHADPVKSSPLVKKWHELAACLEHVRESNRINGLLVSSRLAAVGNALNTLHSAAGATPIYHSDGSARPVRSQSGTARWSA